MSVLNSFKPLSGYKYAVACGLVSAIALYGGLMLASHAQASTNTPDVLAPQNSMDQPFRDLDKALAQIQSDMGQMFDSGVMIPTGGALFPAALTSPVTNILDQDGKYTVTINVPGVDVKDIVATVNGNTLTVSSQVADKRSENDGNDTMQQSSLSTFEDVVQLPDTADVDKADATYRNGQIIVTMPKTSDVRKLSRRLDIKPAG